MFWQIQIYYFHRLIFSCLFSLMIVNTIIGMSIHHDFDLDSAEASVPRSPVILNSDQQEEITFKLNDQNKELMCHVIRGVPSPTVAWIKDHNLKKELHEGFSYEPATGITRLALSFNNSSSRTKPNELNGMYTCIAANFLGQARKSFVVHIIE